MPPVAVQRSVKLNPSQTLMASVASKSSPWTIPEILEHADTPVMVRRYARSVKRFRIAVAVQLYALSVLAPVLPSGLNSGSGGTDAS